MLGLEEEVGLAFGVESFEDALFASKVSDLVLGLEEEVGLVQLALLGMLCLQLLRFVILS